MNQTRSNQTKKLPEPASRDFIHGLHRDFYKDAPKEMLLIRTKDREYIMEPGKWRSVPEHDGEVGRHLPPSSGRVEDFMKYFEEQYRFEKLKQGGRILAMAAAHHRFNFIHPFPDGN